MNIIDARMRAPFGAEAELLRGNRTLGKSKTFGFGCARSAIEASPEMLIQEMDDAHIGIGIITGRGRFADRNGELLAFSDLFPGRFRVLPYLDPAREQFDAEIRGLARHPAVKGFSIQYYSDGATCYGALDAKAMKLYESVAASGLPLMVTVSGHTLPYLDSQIITELDHVAVNFPQMSIIITHGGWPWVTEAIGLAFRRPNVYLIPDCYCTNGPGAQEYVQAANYMIPDKILFGSSYPLISQGQMMEHYVRRAGFREEVLPKVMGENARTLFKL